MADAYMTDAHVTDAYMTDAYMTDADVRSPKDADSYRCRHEVFAVSFNERHLRGLQCHESAMPAVS